MVKFMGKFAEADAEISKTMICRRCKTRNKKGILKCRKCGSPYLRPKNKEIKAKKA
jgi:ribosomal protein L40E